MRFKDLLTQSMRHRSPTFSKNEVKTLLDLIDKYKTVLLNKSSNTTACHAKELTWAKITKIFNSKGFEHKRSMSCLRMKWDNLKRFAKKASENLLEVGDSDFDSQIVTMLTEVEHNKNVTPLTKDSEDDELEETKEDLEERKADLEKYCVIKQDEDSQMFSGGENDKKSAKFATRSMNFTAHECSLLLKCIRAEKRNIFSKETNSAALCLKNDAWIRVTKNFNRQSPTKRSVNMLRTKFSNMKRSCSKNIDISADKNKFVIPKLIKDDIQKIKIEPTFKEDKDEIQQNDDSEQDDDISSNHGQNYENSDIKSTNKAVNTKESPDPLSIIVKESEIGLMNIDTISNSNNNEITKLKLEILKYQLENAKLEKKRIEDAILAEAAIAEARATETELLLRAARLKAVAAASELPEGHPALQYTSEETRAKRYIDSSCCPQT
ncbi:uncharacterized protein LOC135077631 isoform X2 [Ostrinia nubilalis]|uniref:uncharacterized protein LOC135077631 isoform X2 n=1 Tax=Ostrinia nubilalis TaxID=29057 RepID=UPI0030824333